MYYASFGILALILHVIINFDALRKNRKEISSVPLLRYRQFLYGIMIYYISDIMWGFLEESRIVVLAYADTVLYFASMALCVLLWARYVVDYAGRKGAKSTALLYVGWTMLLFIIISLIVNFFRPFIFDFNAEEGYIPCPARYVIFITLFLLHLILSVYSLIASRKLSGKERVCYLTISASGFVMAVFIILQTAYPLLPYYAVGLLVSTSLIHVFVEEDEKRDMGQRLHSVAVKAEREEKKTISFGQIAESLASNYDSIFYVDSSTGEYVGYKMRDHYGLMEIDKNGDDFFSDVLVNIPKRVHRHDRDRLIVALNRDYLLSVLEDRKQYSIDYRVVVRDRPQHTRASIRKSSDGQHFILGIENIDDEVRKEKEHMRALNTEKELARRDELTGTKNKTAYSELEKSVQSNIDNGLDYLPFAIAVCDINDLKKVNDNSGHKAGDDYIKSAAKILCDIFGHSPVFRIGGDEFVIFLRGSDYSEREDLMLRLHEEVLENILNENGPVIAAGMSAFDPENDTFVSQVFERADNAMYEDKRELKRHTGN